jgi:hypothetical protein
LAAIAGRASKFCEAENVKYIAGLWGRDLFRGMTWRKDGPYVAAAADIKFSANLFVPPSEYRAPSWSWASVNGPVSWQTQCRAKWVSEVKEHWRMDCGPRLISCNLLHSSENTYIDTLQGSWIEVHGYYRKLWISRSKLSPEVDWAEGSFIKHIALDIDGSLSDTIYVYLSQPDQPDQDLKELLMFQVSIDGSQAVHALLLEKFQEPNCFRRVGLVKLAGYVMESWPDGNWSECKWSNVDFSSLGKYDESCFPLWRKHEGEPSLQFFKGKEWQKDLWTEGTLKLF